MEDIKKFTIDNTDFRNSDLDALNELFNYRLRKAISCNPDLENSKIFQSYCDSIAEGILSEIEQSELEEN